METHLNLKSFGLRPILIFLMCLKEQKLAPVPAPPTSVGNLSIRASVSGLHLRSSPKRTPLPPALPKASCFLFIIIPNHPSEFTRITNSCLMHIISRWLLFTRKSFWKSKNRYSYQHHYGTHDEEVDPPRPNPARVNRCQVQTVKLNTLICYKIFWRPNNIFIAMWTLSRFGHNEIKKITYSSGSTLSKSV